MLEELRYGVRLAVYGAELGRGWRAEAPDYVLLLVEPSLQELPPARPPWQRMLLPDAPNVQDLKEAIRCAGDDPRTRGVVLHLRAPNMPSSTLETLRGLVTDLKDAGKRTVAWATSYSTGSLYVAMACDEILLQRGGNIGPLGHVRTYPFLADGLERLGLRFQAVPISPYKSAADSLARRDMSAESREQARWLLDAAHRELVNAVADGRGWGDEEAAAAIDRAPYTDLAAVEAGLVDALVAEDELPKHLARAGEPARIERWAEARKHVIPRPPDRAGRHLALLRIEGPIVDGESRAAPPGPPLDLPLVGAGQAGDRSVVQAARKAMEDDDVAAVVVWVDSPGGSSTASEAIASALEALAQRKPVVVAMGAVAASGGYYVATPAHWTIARPSTLTGSIGVLSGKLVVAGLLDRLHINREVLSRGDGARLYDGERPFTPEELETVRTAIARTYDVFVARVASSRGMTVEAVDNVARGRVWTGRQAKEHDLVDALGGLEDAMAKARALAGLGPRAAEHELHVGRERRGPLALAPAAGGATGAQTLTASLGTLQALARASTLCLCPTALEGGVRPR